jgi:integrase
MAKYSKRDYQVGDWWLGQREESAAYYGFRYNAAKRSNERVSLGTDDLERAKEKLTELHLQTRTVQEESPETSFLADLLRRYWEQHASTLRSAKSANHCIGVWLDYWQDATVDVLADIKRQEAFHAFMRKRGYAPAAVMRVLGVGKAAINRAHKRGELKHAPHILSVPVGTTRPMGRPLDVPDLQRIYAHASTHVQAFMLWALGTAARPEAVLELHSRQIDFDSGLVNLNPPERQQVAKKYRPVVRLPDALWESFHGWAVCYEGDPVKSIKQGLWRACDRAKVKRCSPYSFRHTAARWMRRSGVQPWEVAAQLGHSVGKAYAVSERYAAYSPDYLSGAVEALDGLIRLTVCRPVAGQSGEKSEQSRSSSGVEQRIRNAWVGGSIPSCGTNTINSLRRISSIIPVATRAKNLRQRPRNISELR